MEWKMASQPRYVHSPYSFGGMVLVSDALRQTTIGADLDRVTARIVPHPSLASLPSRPPPPLPQLASSAHPSSPAFASGQGFGGGIQKGANPVIVVCPPSAGQGRGAMVTCSPPPPPPPPPSFPRARHTRAAFAAQLAAELTQKANMNGNTTTQLPPASLMNDGSGGAGSGNFLAFSHFFVPPHRITPSATAVSSPSTLGHLLSASSTEETLSRQLSLSVAPSHGDGDMFGHHHQYPVATLGCGCPLIAQNGSNGEGVCIASKMLHRDEEMGNDEEVDENESSSADGSSNPQKPRSTPPPRLPIAPLCSHIAQWKRLRAKRGFGYYVCECCGAKWKTPSGNTRRFGVLAMAAAAVAVL